MDIGRDARQQGRSLKWLQQPQGKQLIVCEAVCFEPDEREDEPNGAREAEAHNGNRSIQGQAIVLLA